MHALGNTLARDFGRILILTVILSILGPAGLFAATNVSSQVRVTQNGFGRNRSTSLWVATITVTNTSGAALAGPIQVVLTNLPANVTMQNNTSKLSTGPSLGPYITVTTAPLAAGASVKTSIQFTNPSNGYINFTAVTYSGGL